MRRQTTRIEGGRLYTLDAMRGLAAIAVALSHLDTIGVHVLPSGHLAVDFFFCLSGLVIGLSYRDRLLGGMTTRAFARLRVIRLWPLYLIGTVLGAIMIVTQAVSTGGPGRSSADVLFAIAPALLMLPDPTTVVLYPANPPAWSLFFELLVNFAFAAWLVTLRLRWLAAVAAAALTGFVVAAIHAGGANLGPEWHQLPGGIARVTFGFTVGIVLARINPRGIRRTSWIAAVPALLVLGPILASTRLWSDLAAIGLSGPLAVALGSRFELPARARRGCEWLGDLSYPLYAVHYPLLAPCHAIARQLSLPALGEGLLFVAIAIAAAVMLAPFDRLIRRWLIRKPAALATI